MPNDAPPLTVAIPTCNGARYLREALQAIRAQDGIDFDLLVSDDRSEDESLEIVRTLAGDCARVETNSERLGLAGNWNRCVELSRTPVVAIFHQDDVMRPGHLRRHLDAWSAQPDLGFVCGAAEVIDPASRPVSDVILARDRVLNADRSFAAGEFIHELAVANPVRCSSATLSKQAHGEAGGFDASYRYVVDWEFWVRVSRRWPVLWLGRPTVAIRWHPGSETHRFKTGTDDLDEALRLIGELHPRDGSRSRERRAAERRLARAFLNRAYDGARASDSRLVRRCLRRAVALDPATMGAIALNPRLAARLALGAWGTRAAASTP